MLLSAILSGYLCKKTTERRYLVSSHAQAASRQALWSSTLLAWQASLGLLAGLCLVITAAPGTWEFAQK